MPPNVNRSWAAPRRLSRKGQGVSMSVRPGEWAQLKDRLWRLAPEVAGVDEIQRRVHLPEPTGRHMQVKGRGHQACMAHQALHHRQFHAAFDQVGGKTVPTMPSSA
jgi:hypothetical protein